MGNYVLASNQYETYYYKAQQIRQKIKQELNKVYQKVNIILLPVTRSVAPKLGSLSAPVNTYLSDVYTLIANLTGAPAITFPAGKIGKLPYGLQLMANNFNDHLLLQAVCAFQRQTKFHRTCQKIIAGIKYMSCYEMAIGLEVHVQLKTNTKLFSNTINSYGKEPNAQANFFDVALCGTLPLINTKAVEMAIMFGLAINAKYIKK